MEIVKTDKGLISGAVTGEMGKEVYVYRGIPYAAPPVGDLRWKPPQPAKAWTGIRECTQFSGISPQVNDDPTIASLPKTEDCLYLNVMTPAKKPNAKLPVMVWMHGGGYFAGCGNDPMWNYHRLPRYGVVVVSSTHRLGPLGLLAHAELSKESPDGVSGNYLFLDLIASLKWVKNNIAAFGGDPDNVTIFGESGGGAKVAMMMCSPLAKGLFHKAICESGTADGISPGKTLAGMEKIGADFFAKIGAKNLDEARKVPWQKIVEVSQVMEPTFGEGEIPVPPWDSAIDGKVLPQSPMQLFQNSAINAVPLLVCANRGELVGPGSFVIPFLVPSYCKMLAGNAKARQPGYAAVFDHVPAHWKKQGVVSFHAIELPYIFGDYDNTTGWWGVIINSMQFGDIQDKSIVFTEIDKAVSETMSGFWTSFAAKGKPKAKDAPDWPVYDAAGDKYMYITEKCEVLGGFSKIAQDK